LLSRDPSPPWAAASVTQVHRGESPAEPIPLAHRRAGRDFVRTVRRIRYSIDMNVLLQLVHRMDGLPFNWQQVE